MAKEDEGRTISSQEHPDDGKRCVGEDGSVGWNLCGESIREVVGHQNSAKCRISEESYFG